MYNKIKALTDRGISQKDAEQIVFDIQYEVLDSHSKKNGWFTDVDLNSLLCSLQVFANANEGINKTLRENGTNLIRANLLTVYGDSYEERADHIIECFKQTNSSIAFLEKLRKPL